MALQAISKEDTQRKSVQEIFSAVSQNARDELRRPAAALAVSGLAGGITMGLTGLAVAIARAHLGDSPAAQFKSMLLYPIGFIAVVIGRAQLFTENTLYPVVLVLDERRHLRSTLRLWATVLPANVVGAFLFALLAVRTGALRPEYAALLQRLGEDSLQGGSAHLFWSGVIGGWLIALVAWMVTASHWTIGQLVVTYLLTFVVGLGHFSHCIATSGEILAAVVGGSAAVGAYVHWLLFATLGNIVGVVIVSLLNYGQVAVGQQP